MEISDDIKKLNKGILPDGLNFTLREQTPIDWNKVRYNSLYKDFSFHEKKFPDGYESIPGFDMVIQQIANDSKSPLEEVLERQKKSNE
jgi:hypothetical protein